MGVHSQQTEESKVRRGPGCVNGPTEVCADSQQLMVWPDVLSQVNTWQGSEREGLPASRAVL